MAEAEVRVRGVQAGLDDARSLARETIELLGQLDDRTKRAVEALEAYRRRAGELTESEVQNRRALERYLEQYAVPELRMRAAERPESAEAQAIYRVLPAVEQYLPRHAELGEGDQPTPAPAERRDAPGQPGEPLEAPLERRDAPGQTGEPLPAPAERRDAPGQPGEPLEAPLERRDAPEQTGEPLPAPRGTPPAVTGAQALGPTATESDRPGTQADRLPPVAAGSLPEALPPPDPGTPGSVVQGVAREAGALRRRVKGLMRRIAGRQRTEAVETLPSASGAPPNDTGARGGLESGTLADRARTFLRQVWATQPETEQEPEEGSDQGGHESLMAVAARAQALRDELERLARAYERLRNERELGRPVDDRELERLKAAVEVRQQELAQVEQRLLTMRAERQHRGGEGPESAWHAVEPYLEVGEKALPDPLHQPAGALMTLIDAAVRRRFLLGGLAVGALAAQRTYAAGETDLRAYLRMARPLVATERVRRRAGAGLPSAAGAIPGHTAGPAYTESVLTSAHGEQVATEGATGHAGTTLPSASDTPQGHTEPGGVVGWLRRFFGLSPQEWYRAEPMPGAPPPPPAVRGEAEPHEPAAHHPGAAHGPDATEATLERLRRLGEELRVFPPSELARAEYQLVQTVSPRADITPAALAAALTDLDLSRWTAIATSFGAVQERPDSDALLRLLGAAQLSPVGPSPASAVETGVELAGRLAHPLLGLSEPERAFSAITEAAPFLPQSIDPTSRRGLIAADALFGAFGRVMQAGGPFGDLVLRAIMSMRGTEVEQQLREEGIDISTPTGLLEARQRAPALAATEPGFAVALASEIRGLLPDAEVRRFALSQALGGDFASARVLDEALSRGYANVLGQEPRGGLTAAEARRLAESEAGRTPIAALHEAFTRPETIELEHEATRRLGEKIEVLTNNLSETWRGAVARIIGLFESGTQEMVDRFDRALVEEP
jgi:hypothetical protein